MRTVSFSERVNDRATYMQLALTDWLYGLGWMLVRWGRSVDPMSPSVRKRFNAYKRKRKRLERQYHKYDMAQFGFSLDEYVHECLYREGN